MVDAKNKGTEIVAPISLKNQKEDVICRDQFTFDEDGKCTACPEGHAPVRHGMRTSSSKPTPALHAFFDGKKCDGCKLKDRCMVRPANNKSGKECHIEIDPALVERDRTRARQDEKWWDSYKIRSGVEATISELNRVNGLKKLRVRRITRVTLAVSLKTTACNVKRWICASAGGKSEKESPEGCDKAPSSIILSFFAHPNASKHDLSRFSLKTDRVQFFTIFVIDFH